MSEQDEWQCICDYDCRTRCCDEFGVYPRFVSGGTRTRLILTPPTVGKVQYNVSTPLASSRAAASLGKTITGNTGKQNAILPLLACLSLRHRVAVVVNIRNLQGNQLQTLPSNIFADLGSLDIL